MASDNIIISGIGLIGPFGWSEDSFSSALLDEINCFQNADKLLSGHKVGEVRDFKLSSHIRNPRAERSPRISQYALAASAIAFKQANLDRKNTSVNDMAIVYGTGNGPSVCTQRSLDNIIERGLASVEPLVFQESVFNAPASLISIQYAITGPVIVLPMGWNSGLQAVWKACQLLRRGLVQKVLVISADELASATLDALDRLGFVSPNNGRIEATKPFGADANGAMFSEGAAAIILENEQQAIERNIKPRARITAIANGMQPDSSITHQSAQGILQGMQAVLASAGRSAEDIDHVLAGTIVNLESDYAELSAVSQLMADRKNHCPVTSIKSWIGESVGPFGLYNIVAGLLELETQQLFPNALTENPHTLPGTEILTEKRNTKVDCVLVNSLGINNTSVSLLLEKAS